MNKLFDTYFLKKLTIINKLNINSRESINTF